MSDLSVTLTSTNYEVLMTITPGTVEGTVDFELDNKDTFFTAKIDFSELQKVSRAVRSIVGDKPVMEHNVKCDVFATDSEDGMPVAQELTIRFNGPTNVRVLVGDFSVGVFPSASVSRVFDMATHIVKEPQD